MDFADRRLIEGCHLMEKWQLGRGAWKTRDVSEQEKFFLLLHMNTPSFDCNVAGIFCCCVVHSYLHLIIF